MKWLNKIMKSFFGFSIDRLFLSKVRVGNDQLTRKKIKLKRIIEKFRLLHILKNQFLGIPSNDIN